MYFSKILACSRRIVRDVVFVIDTNSRIGSSGFKLVRELVENITINLKVNSPETAFGLITFDNFARFEFDIMNHTDLITLLPAINPGLPYYDNHVSYSYPGSAFYYRNTASALSLLLSGSVEGGFLQLRSNASKVAIIIVDHIFSEHTSLRLAANSLHKANIFDTYAVGIDFYARDNDLQTIAGDPSFVFSTRHLTSLTAQELGIKVIDKLCSGKFT